MHADDSHQERSPAVWRIVRWGLPVSLLAVYVFGFSGICPLIRQTIKERNYVPSEFMGAVGSRDLKRAEELLNQGADINEVMPHSQSTALDMAVSQGDLPMIGFLLKHGADPNRNKIGGVPKALFNAACNGNAEAIRRLVAAGASLTSGNGQTVPLIVAAGKGHTQIVKILLEAGVPVNVRSDTGDTALHVAARSHAAETVKLLLASGADRNAVNHRGEKPALTPRAIKGD
jgi:ankyrin repeat protein